MNGKVDIKLLKILDAGHFMASPIATPGSQLENFMGQLNDHFLYDRDSHGLSVVPEKGKMYVVQRTIDMCWYRARIQNIMQTTAGPQASVLLVDVGEQTLIPCSRIRELPKQFENIPYQVMDCHLMAVKPLSLVTSYFDFTTSKQVSKNWTEAATKFVRTTISGCKLQVTIQREDENGRYHVLLYAESPQKQVCVNDELVQQGFAVFSEIVDYEEENPKKAEKRKHQQEKFLQQQQEVMDAFKSKAKIPDQDESTSTDDERPSIRLHRIQSDLNDLNPLDFLRQQVTEMRKPHQTEMPVSFIPAGSENRELANRKVKKTPIQQSSQFVSSSSDENTGRVRFVSARIPATGSGMPCLSREEDTARLKSILKASTSPMNREQEPKWYPGKDMHNPQQFPVSTSESPQYPRTDPNASPQYPGRDLNTSPQYPRRDPNVSPQYPGRDPNASPQYPGRDTNVSPHCPGRDPNASPQYPGRDTNAQYPGRDPTVSLQYPGKKDMSLQYHERDNLTSQYPVRDILTSKYPEGENLSSQYPGRDNLSSQYPGRENLYSQYPGRDSVSSQYPGRDNLSSQYPGRDNQPSQYPGRDNQPSQYPGRDDLSSQYPGRDDLSSQYPGRDDLSSQYPGRDDLSSQYPGRDDLSSQYPGRDSVSSQYPGRDNLSSQYPGRDNLSSQYPGRDNLSSQYPGRDNLSSQYPGRDNLSSQYPGRDNLSSQYPGRDNQPSQYPGRDNLSSQYTNRGNLDQEQIKYDNNHLTSCSRESLDNNLSHYDKRTFNNESTLHARDPFDNKPSQMHKVNNQPQLHRGREELSSILGMTQSSNSSSHGFSNPTQRLPSHITNYSQESTATSSYLPSEAASHSSTVPSHLPSQRLPSEALGQKLQPELDAQEPESCIDDGVLIHGEGVPKPFLSMVNSPLHEKGSRLNITVPTPIQRHMWPALLRGRDVAGIASRNAGKKLAYLLPIMEQVMESSIYSELPLTNGPLALILCRSWSDAITVYQECLKIVGNRRTARVHVIFGGGAEQEQIIPVLNGCEVLVATVPCFLRMLKHSYTPLDRLCHIVFDNADILVEDFTSELKDIMRVYGRHLVSQPGRVAPRQTVVMATSWTVGVASLVRAYLGNPLIIIDDQVEAAVYSGVKQSVELCSVNQRLTRLLGFLDNADRTHEIVVFTNTAQEAESLGEVLRTNNHFVLVAHEFLNPQALADIRRQWYTPHTVDLMPILVLTDGVLMGKQLAIHNASMVIHYDLPLIKNKEKFGRRFFCMASTFTTVKDHGCLSVIFITENCMRQATIAHELVKRTSQVNPSMDTSIDPSSPQTLTTTLLEQMADTAQMAKERDKVNSELCDFLMAYGTCRTFADKKKCTMRHVVLSEDDFPYDLPTMGIVKVLVLHVMNATCLWVRILEHRNPKGETILTSGSGSKFVQMSVDMGMWYSFEANRKTVSMPRVSDLCAIEEDGSYHRVKICDIMRKHSQSGMPLDVQVHFVDQGTYQNAKISSLLQLPPQFHTLPFQAVQVFVCRVKPQDKSLQWTPKANNFVRNLVEGKELEGRVVLSLNNTIWLDPLWEKKVLKSIQVTTNINNIRVELLKNGLAVENKQHIKQLRMLCEEAIDLSIYDGEETLECDSSTTLETVTLPEEDYQGIYVSAVDTPGLFFVQLASYKTQLEELQTKIDEGIKAVQYDDDDEIVIGSLCVACFTTNDMWYRARILGIRPDNEYDVFYVDFGDREWISRDRIRPAWPDILTLPLQGIECSLVNIVPLENDWTTSDGDALWNMCQEKPLFAKVKAKVASLMSGCHRFVVEMIDTSTSIDIVVSNELVVAGHAQTSPEGIQTLFPEATVQLSHQDYKHDYEKIPDMCRDILQARDPTQRVSIAKSLQTVVLNSLNAKDAVREGGGVKSICRLLALTRSPAVQEHLLVSLECLTFQNDSNCEEARREGGLKSLCLLIEKSQNLTVKEHVAWALKNLAVTDKNKDALREMGGVGILCTELENAMEDKVQEQVAWALEVLATDNTKNCREIHDYGGIKTLCDLVSSTSQEFVLERVTRTLGTLAAEPSNRNAIRHDGGLVALCKRIQDSPSEDFLRVASATLKTIVNNNQHNKEVMKDLGMVHTLQKIISSSTYSSITRRLCRDLLERLLGMTTAEFTPSPTKTLTTPIVNGTTGSPHHDIPPLEGSDDEEKQGLVNGFIKKVKKRPLLRPLPKKQQDMSDDSDEQDTSDKSYHPFTTWHQTKDTIRVAVRLRGVKKQTTEIQDKRLTFSTKLHGKKYHLDLELYDKVKTEEKQIDVKGDEVMIVLKKNTNAAWPRLIQSKDKLPYLTIDFDRWEVWSSSDEEEDKKKPFVYLPPKSRTTENKTNKCIVPEMDKTSESSSSDTDFEVQDMALDFA